MSNTSIIPAHDGSTDADFDDANAPHLIRVSKSQTIDIPLNQQQMTFGREEFCDVVFENDPQVSREHCGFRRYSDGIVTVTDFGSRNGTFVNDARIFEETHLNHGDRVRLGKYAEFTLKVPGATEPQPEPEPEAKSSPRTPPPAPKSELDEAAAELADKLDKTSLGPSCETW